ncbi:MAG: DUF1330 domain-containing protein [Methylococcaceae bacterium]|jgi:uncharacterized protein (DUF1330 family)
MTNPTPAKPAYFMVQIKAKNFEETMQRYGQSAIASLMKFGGEMLAGTPAPNVLEGNWDGNWAAVLRFPSVEMAQTWYNSSEYQPLKDLRINELTDSGQVLLIEGM